MSTNTQQPALQAGATSSAQPVPQAPGNNASNPTRPIKPMPKRSRLCATDKELPPPDPTRSGFGDRHAHNSSSLMSSHAEDMLAKGLISSDMAKQLSTPWYEEGVLEVKYDEAYLEGMTKLQPGYDPVVMPTKRQKKKKADKDGDDEWERWLEEGTDDEDDMDDEEEEDDLESEVGYEDPEEEASDDEMEVDDEPKIATKTHQDAMVSTNNGLKPQDLVPDSDDPDSDLSSIASEDLSELGAESDDDDDTDVESANTNKKRHKKQVALSDHAAKRTKGNAGNKVQTSSGFADMVRSFTYDASKHDGEGMENAASPQRRKNVADSGADPKPARKLAPLKNKKATAPGPADSSPKKPAPKPLNPTKSPFFSAPTPWDDKKYFALLAECRERNLPGKGKEADLRARLIEDDENVAHGRERTLNLTRKGGRRKGWVHDENGKRLDGMGEMAGRARENGKFVKKDRGGGDEDEDGKRKRVVEEDDIDVGGDAGGVDEVGNEQEVGVKKRPEKKKVKMTGDDV